MKKFTIEHIVSTKKENNKMVEASGFFKNQDEVRNNLFFFLKKGTSHVRILPAYSEKGVWYREIKEVPWHDENGRYKPIISPATNGEKCPFVEEGQRLYNLGGEDNVTAAKQFRPKSQYIFNVIVKNTPDGEMPVEECVKVMKCGVSVYRQIMDLDQDFAGGWGNLSDLEKGFDIRITREGVGQMDTRYTVKGIPNGRTNILEWLEEKGYGRALTPHNLDELYPTKSYEELLPIVEQMKNPTTLGETDESEDENDDDVPIAPVVTDTVETPKLKEDN